MRGARKRKKPPDARRRPRTPARGPAAMNIVFAGTPEFAARALQSLLAGGFHVPLVLTQPDRPAGRGMQAQMSAVKEVARAHGIEVFQPVSLKKDPDAVARLAGTPMDAMVVAA